MLGSGESSHEAVYNRCALPQELIDQIVDALSSSKHSLRVCTLVAHAWLPSSRRYLFASVQLSEDKFVEFLAFARTCAFGPQYIRELTFNGHQPQQVMSNRTAISPAYLHSLLAYLPQLESLLLFMACLRDESSNAQSLQVPPSNLEGSTGQTSALKSLTIYYSGTQNDRFTDLAHVISVFPYIGRLYMRSQRFRSNYSPDDVPRELADTSPDVIVRLPPVQALVVDDNDFRTNLYLAVAVQSVAWCDNLRAIEIQSRQAWDHKMLGTLLRVTGTRLEYLSLQLSKLFEPENVEAFVEELSLSSCIALASLALQLHPNPFLLRPLSWATLCTLVGSIPRTTLVRHILLQIGVRSSHVNDMLHPWNGMDNILAGFDSLESVAFPAEHFAAYTEQGKELVRGAFPRVSRKARIEFPLSAQ
ncbi:uncharacterized protein PHACADRAFT_201187 [Phanerochaete carnosa HHB-10118-sp]|uniref:F-box domain-containing protein n=1 Tax=Phanerochaete carnosa (strain HHB-10118-sp) TaxID=650164 RepID=K5WJE7_PHACS|nr:uncharacterized protein PHACADRAFT_201187 [Phanerochaete carnosa HHB-10118-sp]EKM50347.1 hypothetical protein PHACADRAFT_201187 [Phanerochaete carnosa HHB-10118-sp]